MYFWMRRIDYDVKAFIVMGGSGITASGKSFLKKRGSQASPAAIQSGPHLWVEDYKLKCA